MATLIELNIIESDSKKDPPIPTPVPPDDITKSVNLLKKIRTAGLKEAEAILDDPTSLPATDPARTEVLEKIAWARQTVQFPDGSADALLRLSLADAPPAATVETILDVTDTQIQNTAHKMVPRLAKGLQVSSR